VVVHNYCRNADHFLRYLAEREIAVEAATPAEVSNYLRAAVRWFRKRHGYSPAPLWHSVPRAAIHAAVVIECIEAAISRPVNFADSRSASSTSTTSSIT
jgi:hypothetical protein